MRLRLLDFLRCPSCGSPFGAVSLEAEAEEITAGILYCGTDHYFPIYKGIPRLLPDSLAMCWPKIAGKIRKPVPEPIRSLVDTQSFRSEGKDFDRPTRANFSNEWDNHDIGGNTWTMELKDRVQWFFLDPIRISKEDLNGKIMLDAGCGNGSQSVAYTEFGLEVVALDLSTGLEKGYEFREIYPKAKPEKVHFIQADLQTPPLAPGKFDIIHSTGVLHHTPDTLTTFKALRPLLKPGGTFYVWLYKYEKFVTPVVNSLRAFTTRMPPFLFARVATLTSVPFMGFCWAVDKIGLRQYSPLNRREATLAVHDIFGAPYAHYHSFEEVSDWYRSSGFTEIWSCNEGRRGFGVCGRLPTNGGD